MNPEEPDSFMLDGLYPDGLTLVLVHAKVSGKDEYKWTAGLPTGETCHGGEYFEIETKNSLVEPDIAMYHHEEIKNPDNHSVIELNNL